MILAIFHYLSPFAGLPKLAARHEGGGSLDDGLQTVDCPWEGLRSPYNPNNQTRIKSLQRSWPIHSLPSLGHFLTPPRAVWNLANISVGLRKGGLPLFSYSRSSEVGLSCQRFLKEAGPERAGVPEGARPGSEQRSERR